MNFNNGVLGECLKLFTDELKEFAIKSLKEVYGEAWLEKATNPPGKDSTMTIKKSPEVWDLSYIISMVHDHWDHVFSGIVGRKFPKAMLTVVKHFRNEYSHQQQMSNRDTYLAIDMILHILEKLRLRTGNIEGHRQELLYAMAAGVTPVQKVTQDICRNCRYTVSLKYGFQCNNCPLISCVPCIKAHHDQQAQFKIMFSCPGCKMPISAFDMELLNVKLKYL